MERLKKAEKLIKTTKKKFVIFSILGAFLVLLISVFSLLYNNSVINNQKIIQKLNNSLNNQYILVKDISLLGNSFEDKVEVSSNKQLIIKFKNLLIKLKSEHASFFLILKELEDSYLLEEMGKIIQESDFSKTINKYIKIASELSDNKPDSRLKISNDIKFLSVNSESNISKLFFTFNKLIKLQNKKSLQRLNQLGLFIIFLCVLEFFLIWLLVFKPIYSAVLLQHQKLYDAILEIESAYRSRSEFLANISHEIRTPMTGILGYAEILKNHDILYEDKVKAVKIINNNSNHLLQLIDEILDVAKIESQKVTIQLKKVNVHKLIKDVYYLFKVKAKEKNIRFSMNSINTIPKFIKTDGKRLKQILINIVGNAIKFTDEGFVHVSIQLEHDQKNNKSKIYFTITDSGIGIKSEDQKKLFLPFMQVDSSESRKKGGTGLGLVLSKGLAKALGGTVVCNQSILGKGSIFEISINTGNVKLEDESSKINDSFFINTYKVSSKEKLKILENKKILVVDDAEENANLFKVYLKKAGAKVEIAYEGKAAFEKIYNNYFDLVLLDIQMPEMNGYEVLEKLKEVNYASPVVALTAHAMDDEIKKSKKAGFSFHITKPIKYDSFVTIISKILQG